RIISCPSSTLSLSVSFFYNATAPTEIYTLSLHDALPIYQGGGRRPGDPHPEPGPAGRREGAPGPSGEDPRRRAQADRGERAARAHAAAHPLLGGIPGQPDHPDLQGSARGSRDRTVPGAATLPARRPARARQGGGDRERPRPPGRGEGAGAERPDGPGEPDLPGSPAQRPD